PRRNKRERHALRNNRAEQFAEVTTVIECRSDTLPWKALRLLDDDMRRVSDQVRELSEVRRHRERNERRDSGQDGNASRHTRIDADQVGGHGWPSDRTRIIVSAISTAVRVS